MKKLFIVAGLLLGGYLANAQTTPTFDVSQLSVPQSSAFKLVDVSPTLIETPSTPKAFTLGVLQNIENSQGWPQNYSAEFTPYWWVLPANRNVYNFTGLKKQHNDITNADEWKENAFSSFKFASVSMAFVNKDMVPDTFTTTQKVFSAGVRTTLIKIHRAGYAKKLGNAIDAWHNTALAEIGDDMNDSIYRSAARTGNVQLEASRSKELAGMRDSLKAAKKMTADALAAQVQSTLDEKPIFAWDFAGAYAMYGIGDTTWKTGRLGVWTTVSLNLPLGIGDSTKNYFSIAGYARYMYDGYTLDNGVVTSSNAIDVGGKLSLQFDRLNIGAEGVYRNYSTGPSLQSQRLVGFINYRIGDNLYLNGTFGKDFGVEKAKLLTLFGIAWGFGNEQASLPQ
ncbi:hypothetical protein [Taibaiella soli]|uniref:DUF5723 domain-containing protein n=1 Tax=Taibaiella soli TaxID=1649169 RepID=A0A2W2B325_9BACT|nr:hypothetical protein [Taibaiella soli]PZF74458.1 hypothetical protein DN068_02435 [Taibaiella soli]